MSVGIGENCRIMRISGFLAGYRVRLSARCMTHGWESRPVFYQNETGKEVLPATAEVSVQIEQHMKAWDESGGNAV